MSNRQPPKSNSIPRPIFKRVCEQGRLLPTLGEKLAKCEAMRRQQQAQISALAIPQLTHPMPVFSRVSAPPPETPHPLEKCIEKCLNAVTESHEKFRQEMKETNEANNKAIQKIMEQNHKATTDMIERSNDKFSSLLELVFRNQFAFSSMAGMHGMPGMPGIGGVPQMPSIAPSEQLSIGAPPVSTLPPADPLVEEPSTPRKRRMTNNSASSSEDSSVIHLGVNIGKKSDDKDESMFTCNSCEEDFFSEKGLVIHFKKEHRDVLEAKKPKRRRVNK